MGICESMQNILRISYPLIFIGIPKVSQWLVADPSGDLLRSVLVGQEDIYCV